MWPCSIGTVREASWWLYFTGTRVKSDECKFWGVTSDDNPVVTLTRGAVSYPLIAILYEGAVVEEREGTVYMDESSKAFEVYSVAMLARRLGLPFINSSTREPMKKIPTRVVVVDPRNESEMDLDNPDCSILEFLVQSNFKGPWMKKGRFVDGRLELEWTVTTDRAWH
jgi:hypothetical protein